MRTRTYFWFFFRSSLLMNFFLDLDSGSHLLEHISPLCTRVRPEHLVHNTKELCGEGIENAAEVDADVRERD